MFTTQNPTHNRLLALEQELLGQQHFSRIPGGDQANPASIFQPTWDDRELNEDEVWNDQEDEVWNDQLEELTPEQSSYVALADMLHRNASQRFKGNVSRLQAKWKTFESWKETRSEQAWTEESWTEETIFEPPTSRIDPSSLSNYSRQEASRTAQNFELPALDLPLDLLPDSLPDDPVVSIPSEISRPTNRQLEQQPNLPIDSLIDDRASTLSSERSDPIAEPPDSFPDSSSIFSSGESSYTSLMLVLQAARRGDRSSPQPLTTEIDSTTAAIVSPSELPAHITRTLDVEAYSVPETEIATSMPTTDQQEESRQNDPIHAPPWSE